MIIIPSINIVIGDLHFGRYSNDLKELEISIKYFKDFIIPLVKQLIEKHGKDNVGIIQVGDVYDNRSLISTEIQDSILDIFEELSELCLTIVDTGNHDKFNQTITTSRVISYIKNCIVVTKPTRFESVGGKKISIFPALEHKDKLYEALAKDSPADYFFGHDDIAGFSHEGVMVKEDKAVNIDNYGKYKYVIQGHIHKAQTKRNVVYVGSAYHTRKNEWENTPQVMIIDIDKEEHYFLKNNVSPRYLNIYLNDLLELTVGEANQLIKNNRVSVFVDDFNKVNTTKISEHLTGYYSLKYDQKIGKIYSQEENDNNLYDENIKYEINDDIKESISEFIKSNDSFIIEKQLIPVNDKTKTLLITKLNNLYDMSKDKVKMIDIEE